MTGLRFECQPGCTNCCRQKGFVYITEGDLDRMAKFVGMRPRDVERSYVEEGCSIHPAKPTQCRIFPFWPELVDSKREWQKTAAYCPGIGKGELIQIETARGQAEEMRRAYPGMYGDSA
jgi:uncharacterized protein